MNTTLKIGDQGEIQFTVEAAQMIQFDDPRMPAVLSTPSLIWFLEHAAINALAPALGPDECSLGTHIDIQHLAPTPQGAAVRCTARVIHTEGATVTFQVEAHDGQDRIARGIHRRSIVRIERFAARVRKKQGRAAG